MIRVVAQPEPLTFNQSVRIPGNLFLRQLRRTPNKDEWKQNAHWRYCLNDLQSAYRDICAFTACWSPASTSVDHFLPKSARPDLAYEWSNYRLASQKVNSKKGNSTVLDPFTVDDAWFVLDFSSSRVKPSRQQTPQVQASVQTTINTLGLNDEAWVKLRFAVLRQYATGKVMFEYLVDYYPFIARELERQGLKTTILGSMT